MDFLISHLISSYLSFIPIDLLIVLSVETYCHVPQTIQKMESDLCA